MKTVSDRRQARLRKRVEHRLAMQSKTCNDARLHLGGKLFPGTTFSGGTVIKFSLGDERFAAFAPNDTPNRKIEDAITDYLNDDSWNWD